MEEPGGFRGRLGPGEEQPRALPAHNSFSLERGRVLQPPLFSRRAPAAFFPFAIIILVKQKGKLCTIWIMLTIAYLEPVFSPPSLSPAFFSSLRSGLGLYQHLGFGGAGSTRSRNPNLSSRVPSELIPQVKTRNKH